MLSNTELDPRYPIALLLSISKQKTFESLGTKTGVSGDKIARIVDSGAVTMQELIVVALKAFRNKKFYIVVDDTLILKLYSRNIPGACDNYSSSGRSIERSLCSVVAVLTDGNIAIPVEQSIWTSEEFFRTAKQKLGLSDYLSRKLERQKNHIKSVFAAYSVAQLELIKRKSKNVEEAIKSIKLRNLKNPNYSNERFRETFRHV
jgi:hypothetical protein